MDLTGEPAGPPTKCGVSVIDFAGGYASAIGLPVAVFDAERTGEGREVDVSLLDPALHMLNYLATWRLNDGFQPGRIADSGHSVLVPAQNFATADGTVTGSETVQLNPVPRWTPPFRIDHRAGREPVRGDACDTTRFSGSTRRRGSESLPSAARSALPLPLDQGSVEEGKRPLLQTSIVFAK